MKITAANRDKSKSHEVDVEFPADLDAAIEEWGAEAVYTLVVRQASTDVQNLVRLNIEKTEEEVQKLATDWTPGTRRKGTGVKKSVSLADLANMSQEQIAALLAKAKEAQAAQAAAA